MARTVEQEVEQAKANILAGICRVADVLGVEYTGATITETAASLCIEDDAGRADVADALRDDDWKVISTFLYGRAALVIC